MLKKLKRLHQTRADNGEISVMSPERLYMRDADEILCFWQGSMGSFGWLFRRGTQLYFYLVLGKGQPKGINWAQQSPGDCDIVRAFMSLLGFTEYSLHCLVSEVGAALSPLYRDMDAHRSGAAPQPAPEAPHQQEGQATDDAAGTD